LLGDGATCATATSTAGLVGRSHGGMKRRKVTHHAFVLVLLVGVYGLSMLPQVIETRKLLAAMTRKRPFASVFSDVPCQMLTTRKDHSTVAEAFTLESFCGSGSITLVDATNVGRTRHV